MKRSLLFLGIYFIVIGLVKLIMYLVLSREDA